MCTWVRASFPEREAGELLASLFCKHEVDGCALLLMCVQDLLQIGVLLGPAVKLCALKRDLVRSPSEAPASTSSYALSPALQAAADTPALVRQSGSSDAARVPNREEDTSAESGVAGPRADVVAAVNGKACKAPTWLLRPNTISDNVQFSHSDLKNIELHSINELS